MTPGRTRDTALVEPTYFRSPAQFRRWLERHHDRERELLVGFYKTSSDHRGITQQEALDEALAFGWIDGVRRRVDDDRYTVRYSPRTPRSNWSKINIERVGELRRAGRMHQAGIAAFEARDPSRSGMYSFENPDTPLPRAYERRFRAEKDAWAFFQSQAPSYQRTARFWVMAAKREETRERRLTQLIADSAAGRRVPPLTSPIPRRSTAARGRR